jgi:hypothetical protein
MVTGVFFFGVCCFQFEGVGIGICGAKGNIQAYNVE